MITSKIQQLFDRLIQMEPGRVIVLQFATDADMRSKKTLLFREKKRYENKLGNKAKDVFIVQKVVTEEGIFQLHLSVGSDELEGNAFVLEKDGSVNTIE